VIPEEHCWPDLCQPSCSISLNVKPDAAKWIHDPFKALGRRPLSQSTFSDDLETYRSNRSICCADQQPEDISQRPSAKAGELAKSSRQDVDGHEVQEKGDGEVWEEDIVEKDGCDGHLGGAQSVRIPRIAAIRWMSEPKATQSS
jgi:hypothetical protein